MVAVWFFICWVWCTPNSKESNVCNTYNDCWCVASMIDYWQLGLACSLSNFCCDFPPFFPCFLCVCLQNDSQYWWTGSIDTPTGHLYTCLTNCWTHLRVCTNFCCVYLFIFPFFSWSCRGHVSFFDVGWTWLANRERGRGRGRERERERERWLERNYCCISLPEKVATG